MAADRPSHTSLSNIYWDPYEKTQHTETKLMLCGLTTLDAAHLLPFAKAWLSPPTAHVSSGDALGVSFDPSQRAFVVRRAKGAKMTRLSIVVAATSENPLVNPAFVVENWNGTAGVTVITKGVKSTVSARMGNVHNLDGDSLVVYLPFQSNEQAQIEIDPTQK